MDQAVVNENWLISTTAAERSHSVWARYGSRYLPASSFIPVRPASAASYRNISTWHDLDEVSGTDTVGHGRVVEQRRVVVGEHLVDRVTGGVEPEVLMCLDQGGQQGDVAEVDVCALAGGSPTGV